jgi:subtilisin family serine protease
MKTLLQKLFVFVLLIGFIQACNEPLVEEQTMDDVELKSAQNGKISYIVVLNDDELNTELANLKGYEMSNRRQKAAEKVMKRAGVTDGELGFVYGTAIKGFSVKIPPGQLKKLENDPSVLRVSEDQIITLIEPSAKPGGDDVQATAQTTPWGITRVGGGENYSGTNVAWIIDTGIDLDHPDLNVDASRSAWFVSRVNSANDDNGHGTHVAGTVAAINNGEGVIGVAAGATVIPVKVLDRRGSGSISGVIAGVDYVAANGKEGDVANMSLGGSYYKDLNDAVIAASKNVKFSLAAGNESTDANTKSPASANGTNIYTISAMAQGDVWASYSNYGNPPIDYCAPGSSIYSTYKDGSYATASGTSMAAPHVAGILLLGSVKTDGYVSGDPDGNQLIQAIASVSGGGTTPNNPPVADAGPDQTLTDSDGDGKESVQLDGSGSTDDNGIISYSWTINGSQISTGVSPAVDLAVGKHTITLTVTDGGGLTDTDNVTITVNSATQNLAPVADAGPDQILTDNDGNGSESVILDGSGSTDDNGIVSYIWTLNNDQIGEGVTPSVNLATGIHTITLTVVQDSEGLTDTDDVVITVNEPSGGISLTATGYKIRGRQTVDLFGLEQLLQLIFIVMEI